jgi:hypothetical protein
MASAQILTNGKALYAYNGTEWVPLNTTGNLVNSTRWQKVMTGGETSLSGNDDSGESLIYTPGYEQVYLNGVLLARDADYTATTGTTITGLTALTAGHIVEIIAYNNINVGNTYTQGQIDNKIANTFTRWIDTLSASATVLSGLDDNSTTLSYTPGLEQVYVNGILLLPSEYTATSGSSVVLSEAAVENDVIQIYTLKNFRVPNTYTIGQTDDQFLTKTSASSTYLTQAAGITAATASATYAPVAAGGLVQLVPSSIAVVTGTGTFNSNGKVSFSGASSVSLNDVFSATYDNYLIIINGKSDASAGDVNFRLRASNSDNSSSVYGSAVRYASSGSGTGFIQVGNTNTSTTIGYLTANLYSTQNVKINRPFETIPTNWSSENMRTENSANGTTEYRYGGHSHGANYSATGFTIIFGNNATGTISIYGHRI